MGLAVTSLLPADAVIVERAPAKLNLDLILTGRRLGGYELDSVVAFADVGDELADSERADDLKIECTGHFADDHRREAAASSRRAALRLAESCGRGAPGPSTWTSGCR